MGVISGAAANPFVLAMAMDVPVSPSHGLQPPSLLPLSSPTLCCVGTIKQLYKCLQ